MRVSTNRYKRLKVYVSADRIGYTAARISAKRAPFPATVVATKKASLEIGYVLSDVIHIMIHDVPGTGTPKSYQRATGPSRARTELNGVRGQQDLGKLGGGRSQVIPGLHDSGYARLQTAD